MFWYNKHIEEEFIVYRVESDRYWTREREGYLNFVLKQDCQLVVE
jgi:hypothetical protein